LFNGIRSVHVLNDVKRGLEYVTYGELALGTAKIIVKQLLIEKQSWPAGVPKDK
jgi:hypothetical protein